MAMQTMHTIAHDIPAGRADQRVADVIQQAEDLLSQLEAAQQASELRQSETGRPDPMKSITGRSSIETAIARTESLLDVMHALESQKTAQSSPTIHINTAACAEALSSVSAGNSVRKHRSTTTTHLALAR